MKRTTEFNVSKSEEKIEKRRKTVDEQIDHVTEEKVTTQEVKSYEPLMNGIYLTKVRGLDPKFNEKAISLFELISRINPIASIHFNFNMEPEFIIRNYPRRCRETPISLVIGQHHLAELNRGIRQLGLSNITTAAAKIPIAYGTHHTKLSMFESENAIHIVISTANLIPEDWIMKTDAFYYARAPFKYVEYESGEEGSSGPNNDGMNPFQSALLEYLKKAYTNSDAWRLVEYWVDRISHDVDFSAIKDSIIASVPGRHLVPDIHDFGHMKLRKMLSQRLTSDQLKKLTFKVCQFSSIGSMGANVRIWLGDQFLSSLSGGPKNATDVTNSLLLVFPSVEDVRNSLEGYMAGGSLMNHKKTAEKQSYLNGYFHRWKSDSLGRTHAMPHIKTFTALEDLNPDSKPTWMLLTSANLSQAAWGTLEKNNSQLFIRSYELGVLLFAEDHPEYDKLPLPYDWPLTKYAANDKVWITDGSYLIPDVNGNIWSRPV